MPRTEKDTAIADNIANVHSQIGSLRQEAAAGCPIAQCSLGIHYEFGIGVERSYEEAARLYILASAQGLAHAMRALAGLYRDGRGVCKDEREALRLCQAADAAVPLPRADLGH
jgi:TPR repeat protein